MAEPIAFDALPQKRAAASSAAAFRGLRTDLKGSLDVRLSRHLPGSRPGRRGGEAAGGHFRFDRKVFELWCESPFTERAMVLFGVEPSGPN